MAQATFKFSDDEHPLEANLIVEYIDRTGSKMEKDFPFNCGKDLQTYMKDIFEENWKELLKIMRLRTALYTAQLEVLILEAKITKAV
jgi:hypothetical protein